MGFKDIRAMTVISDRLEDLNCKLYGFLESAAIDTAKMYSKDELEKAQRRAVRVHRKNKLKE